ncbi:MAG: LuxR C-terminal-related transcriptional regulator [Sphingobacteriaceae bacterium]
MKKRIIIADNYPLGKLGYSIVLNEHFKDFDLFFVTNEKELVLELKKRKYELLILSLTTPGKNMLDLVKLAKQKQPSIAVLVNCIYNNKQLAIKFIKAGALGYLCRENSIDELIKAIKTILQKKVYLTSPQTLSILKNPQKTNNKLENLSNREFEIFQLLAYGNSTKNIAFKLNLQQNTISTYRKRLQTKLDINNTIELSRIAQEHGLV